MMKGTFFSGGFLAALIVAGLSGAAWAEPRMFHNFQAEVPKSWTLASETISADLQSTLVKFVSHDGKVHLSVNMENTGRPAREEVSRLVEIYGGDKVFKPFKRCGDLGFRQGNPNGGWLALCALGGSRLMSLVLDGRETREVTRFVASIRLPEAAVPAPADAEAEAEVEEATDTKAPKADPSKGKAKAGETEVSEAEPAGSAKTPQ
jgi:hypothetical protein